LKERERKNEIIAKEENPAKSSNKSSRGGRDDQLLKKAHWESDGERERRIKGKVLRERRCWSSVPKTRRKVWKKRPEDGSKKPSGGKDLSSGKDEGCNR